MWSRSGEFRKRGGVLVRIEDDPFTPAGSSSHQEENLSSWLEASDSGVWVCTGSPGVWVLFVCLFNMKNPKLHAQGWFWFTRAGMCGLRACTYKMTQKTPIWVTCLSCSERVWSNVRMATSPLCSSPPFPFPSWESFVVLSCQLPLLPLPSSHF